MTDTYRPYVLATDDGADDMDDEAPKVEGGQDAGEYLDTLKTPRRLPKIPPLDD